MTKKKFRDCAENCPELINIKNDIVKIKVEFETIFFEINNAIKQVADYVRISPEQSCIIAIKNDISNLKKKYNKIFAEDLLAKLKGQLPEKYKE